MPKREALSEMTDWPTLPKVFINGKFYGDTDILGPMAQNGELQATLERRLRRRAGGAETNHQPALVAFRTIISPEQLHERLGDRGSRRHRLPALAGRFRSWATALRRVASSRRLLCVGRRRARRRRRPARTAVIRCPIRSASRDFCGAAASTTSRKSSPTTPAAICLPRAFGFSRAGSATTTSPCSTAALRPGRALGYPVTSEPPKPRRRHAHRTTPPGISSSTPHYVLRISAAERCNCSTRAHASATPANRDRSTRLRATFPARATDGSKRTSTQSGRFKSPDALRAEFEARRPRSQAHRPSVRLRRFGGGATTSRWTTPASKARASTTARGANGSPTPHARSNAADAF